MIWIFQAPQGSVSEETCNCSLTHSVLRRVAGDNVFSLMFYEGHHQPAKSLLVAHTPAQAHVHALALLLNTPLRMPQQKHTLQIAFCDAPKRESGILPSAWERRCPTVPAASGWLQRASMVPQLWFWYLEPRKHLSAAGCSAWACRCAARVLHAVLPGVLHLANFLKS